MSAMNYLQPAKQPSQAATQAAGQLFRRTEGQKDRGLPLSHLHNIDRGADRVLDGDAKLLSNVGRCQSSARRGHKSQESQRMSKAKKGDKFSTLEK